MSKRSAVASLLAGVGTEVLGVAGDLLDAGGEDRVVGSKVWVGAGERG
ncbi:hypothetical protein ACGF3K_29970 [Streptomyces sp. NPDC047980]